MATEAQTLIRRGEPCDAAALAALHVATVVVAYADIFPRHADPPTPADLEPSYRALLDATSGPRAEVVVAERTDSLAGAIVVIEDDGVPEGVRIERFNVAPDAQGRGLGRRLYARALAVLEDWAASSANLWVLEDNDRARAIYERWGWTLVPGWVLPNEPPDVLDVLYRIDFESARTTTS